MRIANGIGVVRDSCGSVKRRSPLSVVDSGLCKRGRRGLNPQTPGSTVRYSNQLSYGPSDSHPPGTPQKLLTATNFRSERGKSLARFAVRPRFALSHQRLEHSCDTRHDRGKTGALQDVADSIGPCHSVKPFALISSVSRDSRNHDFSPVADLPIRDCSSPSRCQFLRRCLLICF